MYSRETPQRWVHFGALGWAVRNGLALGYGATSRIGFWSWYAVPLGALLGGDPVAGALVYGGYGLTRGGAAWLLIAATAILRRRGAGFDDLALWLLGRQASAHAVSATLMLFLGGLVAIAGGT